MDERQFEEILKRLDTLIRISVINAFQDKSRLEVIRMLMESGFENRDIAFMTGASPGYVANVKSDLKKGRKSSVSINKSTTEAE